MSTNKLLSKQYDSFHNFPKIQTKTIDYSNFTYHDILKILFKYLKNNGKVRNVLDIGCGVGTLSLFFAKQGYHVTGIDISKNAIRAANLSAKKMKIKNVEFYVLNFPFKTPQSKFDFIIFSEVLEHIKEDRIALKKINNLLNKNGILFLTTPSINAPLLRFEFTKKFDKRVGHLRRYAEKRLISLSENAGFKVIEIQKKEGIIRNFLFIHPIAGKFIRFIKYPISEVVTFLDNITIKMLGGSNIFLVLQKK